jgi:hypothetical protein
VRLALLRLAGQDGRMALRRPLGNHEQRELLFDLELKLSVAEEIDDRLQILRVDDR